MIGMRSDALGGVHSHVRVPDNVDRNTELSTNKQHRLSRADQLTHYGAR